MRGPLCAQPVLLSIFQCPLQDGLRVWVPASRGRSFFARPYARGVPYMLRRLPIIKRHASLRAWVATSCALFPASWTARVLTRGLPAFSEVDNRRVDPRVPTRMGCRTPTNWERGKTGRLPERRKIRGTWKRKIAQAVKNPKRAREDAAGPASPSASLSKTFPEDRAEFLWPQTERRWKFALSGTCAMKTALSMTKKPRPFWRTTLLKRQFHRF